MRHIIYAPDSRYEFLVFEPEDWTEDEREVV